MAENYEGKSFMQLAPSELTYILLFLYHSHTLSLFLICIFLSNFFLSDVAIMLLPSYFIRRFFLYSLFQQTQ